MYIETALFVALFIVALYHFWRSHAHGVLAMVEDHEEIQLEYGILQYLNLSTCRVWCYLYSVQDNGKQVRAEFRAELEVYNDARTSTREITWQHNQKYTWREVGRVYSEGGDVDYILYARPNRTLRAFEVKIRQNFDVRITMHCIEVRSKHSIANEK